MVERRRKPKSSPFANSREYVGDIAEKIGKMPVKIKEVDRVCAYKQAQCITTTFHTGVTFFGIFILVVFGLNFAHEFLHKAFMSAYSITMNQMFVGLLLGNIDVTLPIGLPWWDYFIMIYGPIIFFFGILLVIMWIYPRIDVSIYRDNARQWAIARYGKMALRATGIYLSTTLIINTALSPVVNFAYQIFSPSNGRTDFVLLWDLTYNYSQPSLFIFQSVLILTTIAITLGSLAFIFFNRIFAKEKISLG